MLQPVRLQSRRANLALGEVPSPAEGLHAALIRAVSSVPSGRYPGRAEPAPHGTSSLGAG